MDIKKFEINLQKINTLKQNIDLSGEEISGLEIALLKNYIKKMYRAIAPEDEDYEVLKSDTDEKITVKESTEKPEIKEELTEKSEEIPEAFEEIEQESNKDEVISEVVEEESNDNGEEERIYDEKLLEIFSLGKTSELSEKLSSIPVADIKKAIGLNDRIFTINELFGGDKDLFNKTLEHLNGLEDFEQAKDYLLKHIAVKYDWSTKDNLKKAKRFIKVVKRRFGVA
jgi:hypothetical protein